MPRIVDHDQRRREIVRALWAVIHERGIPGVTLRAVAQEAGISIGRIQHYFTSKDELVLAGCRAIIGSAEQAYLEDGGDTGPARVAVTPAEARDRLEDLVVHLVPAAPATRLGAGVWFAYVAQAAVDPRIADVIAEAMGGTRTLAAGLVAMARGLDEAGDEERRAALALVALADGLAQRVVAGALDSAEAQAAARAAVAASDPMSR